MATIVSVHGTGATGPEQGERWWQRGSRFEAHLMELVASDDGGDLKLEPLIWSGANSETDRRAAGEQLLKKCRELERRNEAYSIIGHSHGGSVVSAALFLAARQGEKLPRLRTWITVGTPFLAAARRRLLFNRINFWEKTAYVLVLTACLFLYIGISALPEVQASVASLDKLYLKVALHVAVFFILAFPILLVLLVLGFLSARRCYSGKKRSSRRFESDFGSRWWSFFHSDDEAIRGLSLATQIRFPIFRRLFLLPQLSLLALLFIPAALLMAITSEDASMWLFKLLDRDGYMNWPPLMIENGTLKGQGKDLAINALLIVAAPLSLVELIGLGWLTQSLFTDMPAALNGVLPTLVASIVQSLIVLTFYAFVFYVPALLAVVAAIGLGGVASVVASRVLDDLTWRQLRASAFGDDHLAERIAGTGVHPMWMAGDRACLPEALARELSAFSDRQAAQSIARMRSALNVLAFAEGGRERSDMLSQYLTWEELIHTSYFEVPRFRKLVAAALADAQGFRPTEAFKADPDYPVLRAWLDQLRPPGPAVKDPAAPSPTAPDHHPPPSSP